jgi:hypothetical protein
MPLIDYVYQRARGGFDPADTSAHRLLAGFPFKLNPRAAARSTLLAWRQ